MTSLPKTKDKFVTDHNKCSNIPPSTAMHFATRVLKIACCSSGLIFTSLCAVGSIQNVSRQFVSPIHLQSINFALHPAKQTKIKRTLRASFKQPCLGNRSALDTFTYELIFYSQWPIIGPPKILTFPPESSCIAVMITKLSECTPHYMSCLLSFKHQLYQKFLV
jgi:hypothetical protein